MFRPLSVSLALILLCLCLSCSGGDVSGSRDYPDPVQSEADIRALTDRILAAFNARDVDALVAECSRIAEFSQAFKFQFDLDTQGRGPARFRDVLNELFDQYDPLTLEFNQGELVLDGEGAYWNGELWLRGSRKDNQQQRESLDSALYFVYEDGVWKLFALGSMYFDPHNEGSGGSI